MTVSVMTGPETDRLLSLRTSSGIPLPPEICLSDPSQSSAYFRWISFYETFGQSEHPVVRRISVRRIDSMAASALSRAEHLERVSHLSAWMGREPVRVVVPDMPVNDDPPVIRR